MLAPTTGDLLHRGWVKVSLLYCGKVGKTASSNTTATGEKKEKNNVLLTTPTQKAERGHCQKAPC